MPTETLLAYVTFPDKELALKTAAAVVKNHCAAGANLIGPIHSVYWWEEEMRQREEWLLLAQISASAHEDFERLVMNLHTDAIPCVIAMPIAKAHEPFRQWILGNSR